ncbi:MAG: hypothetical protein WBM83_10060 [Flavobacteriaceae bacterium]
MFNNLQNVSSLKLLLGRTLNLDEVLQVLLFQLQTNFARWETISNKEALVAYEGHLFRKDKPSTFEDRQGKRFMGFIRGVSNDGKLKITLEDDILKEFDLKELKLCY